MSSYVYLGAHNLYDTEDGRKIIYTTEFISHPDYDQDSIANDVSLVRLPSGSLTGYTDLIRPACLPPRHQQYFVKKISKKALGAGNKNHNAHISTSDYFIFLQNV